MTPTARSADTAVMELSKLSLVKPVTWGPRTVQLVVDAQRIAKSSQYVEMVMLTQEKNVMPGH